MPLAEPKVPQVKDPKWSRTVIDRFVLARLEKEGMRPVRAASRHDLIRRASLDLTGLPPLIMASRLSNRSPPMAVLLWHE